MKRLFAAAIAATALCGAPVAAVPNNSDSILSNVSYTKVPALYTATARYAERALVDSGYCPVGTCSGQVANGLNTPNIAALRTAKLENRLRPGSKAGAKRILTTAVHQS